MAFFQNAVCLSVVWALTLTVLAPSDCIAECLACWELKGVIVTLKNGKIIKGYAAWNDAWAAMNYEFRGKLSKKKKFPEVIFDPLAGIEDIAIYTHVRSVKYPPKRVVATRQPIVVKVKKIRDVELNPGSHDGYCGAGSLPVVSLRIARLLQTKPMASCVYEEGSAEVNLLSYDRSFRAEEFKRLCEKRISDEEFEKMNMENVIRLEYAYD
jgi:hypothetical protein